MHRQDDIGQSDQGAGKRDTTVLHRAGVGSAIGTRTNADRAADSGAEVGSFQSSPGNITTAPADYDGVVIDGMGWKRDLTRECVEPNPGFDRTWKEGEGATWLDSLKAKYPFAPRFAKYSGEDLFTFTLEQMKDFKLGDDMDVAAFYNLVHKEAPKDESSSSGGTEQFQKRNFNTRSFVVHKRHFVVPPQELSLPRILDHVENGEYALIHGHWQSGKSTHAEYAGAALRAKGYLVLFIDFQAVHYASEKVFWRSICMEMLKYIKGSDLGFPETSTAGDLLKWIDERTPADLQIHISAFLNTMQKPDVVILADEFTLLNRSLSFAEGFFDLIRSYRNAHTRTPPTCRLKSFIGFGTYDISRFAYDDSEHTVPRRKASPFNMSLKDTVPHFTIDQNRTLFKQAGKEYDVQIEEAVMDDIFSRVRGHPGLTCESGVLLLRDAVGSETYIMRRWKTIVRRLVDITLESETVQEIFRSISSNSDIAQRARDLLFYHHLLQEAPLPRASTMEMKEAQDYLLAYGVLVQDKNGCLDFASPLLRQLLIERLEVASGGPVDINAIFSRDRNSFFMFPLIAASIPIFRRGAIITERNRNKTGEIGESCLHFEFFHAIRYIFDTRESQMRKEAVTDIAPFEIYCEVKEKTTRRRRHDVLIENGSRFLLEIKADASDLFEATNQVEDYSEYYDDVTPCVVAFDCRGVSDDHIAAAQRTTQIPIYVVTYDNDFMNIMVRCLWDDVKREQKVVFGSAQAPIDPVQTGVRGQRRKRVPTAQVYPYNKPYNNR